MTEVTFERALAAVREHLSPDALAHARRVSDTAAGIAESYGEDPDPARLAGLLHDWARDLGGDDLVAAARERDIEVTDLDVAVPYLLHARIGEESVREDLPGLPPEIVAAIGRHTCGAGEMGPLDKIVYVADMIEPARDFEAVVGLRQAVGAVSLDELFRLAYSRSVAHLIETRRHIHPDTVDVWNTHVAGQAES